MERKISAAVTQSKNAFHTWKKAGKPVDPHNELVINRKLCEKRIRREINIAKLSVQNSLYHEIAGANANDSKLFHRIINSQRQCHSTPVSVLYVNNRQLTTPEDICEGFGEHFSKLARPTDNERPVISGTSYCR